MNALSRKLWRTIWGTKGQFFAVVAVVMLGVAVYISMSTNYLNLKRSQESFYRESNFAGYYFHVVRAPQQVTRQIESLPGVARATGRIVKDLPVLREGGGRADARLFSLPLPVENEVNRPVLMSGRMFEEYPQGGTIEVLADPQYVEGNQLAWGDQVAVVAEGRKVFLTVVGAATSPEFTYVIKDLSSFMPDPGAFGVFIVPHNQAEQFLGMSGQVNQVVVTFAPGADEEWIAGQIEDILSPYGFLTSYPRKDQLSHAMLQGELDQLQVTARFMPAIFLGIAAAIQFVIISRMVRTQRLQIGVMKALGYNNRQIVTHYSGYALAVAFTGAFFGILLGIQLATYFSDLYAYYFNLPQTIGGLNKIAIFNGLALCAGVSLAAGLSATRGVLAINPAESMRPEPPSGTGHIFLEKWHWLWSRVGPAWRMSLRTAIRKWGRSTVTVVGVIFAVAMLVISLFMFDAIDYMIDRQYNQEQNYDMAIRFTGPIRESELFYLTRIEGVYREEPFFELPARLWFNGRSEEELLTGLAPDATMKKALSEAGETLQLPEEGILLNRQTAGKLGVGVGDMVEVETLLTMGPTHRDHFVVTGLSDQFIGGGSYVALDQVNRILQENRLVTGVMFKVDPGKIAAIEAELNELTGISSIATPLRELENFYDAMDSAIYTVYVLVGFAVVLGFAIVYNSSVITFIERRRDFATLRVVGYSRPEVSGLLLKENLLQSLLGVALGLPFGRFLADQYIQAMSTDLFSFPVIIYPLTYVYSALGAVFFITVAHLLVVRGIGRLELVEVLKDKD